MRIVFLNKYQNKVSRGAETFVRELAMRLSNHYKVDVISDVNYLELIKNKYDIVIPTNGRLQVFLVRIITWFTGSKMVVSGQSGAGLDDRFNLYSFPNVFIALSSYQEKWAKKINPFINVRKIPNGVDLNTFKGQPQQGATNKIVSVGAFTKDKRHDLTINAVSKLNNAKLTIVGSGGGLKQEIKQLGQKLLGDRFKIISTGHSKMPEIYNSASVLAFPTVTWESFGIAIVEAMACGLPVVATNDPIRREIVGDAGILVDPTNVSEYTTSLQRALDTNWGDIPREQAEKFSWDEIAGKYEELFKTLVN